MKKVIFLILLMNICFVLAEQYEEYPEPRGYLEDVYIEKGMDKEPLLSNFYKLYGDFITYDERGAFYAGNFAITPKEEQKKWYLKTIRKMVLEMDNYFEKKGYKIISGYNIGYQMLTWYEILIDDFGYKANVDHAAENDNFRKTNLPDKVYLQKIAKWITQGMVETKLKSNPMIKNRQEAEALVNAMNYLYTKIPDRMEESKRIIKKLFNSKKFDGLDNYFTWTGYFGIGDVALTNFYQNYKIPKQLYTNGYLPKYLNKLEGFYKNEVVIKKNKMSRWKRLITTLPEEEILENIEEERKKYKKWQKGRK